MTNCAGPPLPVPEDLMRNDARFPGTLNVRAAPV
jgi:hypothetical protein